jgi:septum formation protein
MAPVPDPSDGPSLDRCGPQIPLSPDPSEPRSRLILASRSPQRRAILDQLRISYEAVPVKVDERSVGAPAEVARANALAKARAGALARPGSSTILGVDTIVVLEGEIFGKPATAQDAAATLGRLQGRTHEVVSGLVLLAPHNTQVVHEATEVTFRELDDAAITRYVRTGEWRERAGGYAVQGQGAALVRRIMGDYLNVVGLPVGAMLDLDLSFILRQG